MSWAFYIISIGCLLLLITTIITSRKITTEIIDDKLPEGAYSNYTFWSSDFHISPIADLKDLFGEMNMLIIDESLSGHCHLKNSCSTNLKVINKRNGIDLGNCPNELRREFFETYKNDTRMRSVDAFLCHHAAGLCEVFMPFNASLLVIASTRYEIGRYDPIRWNAWNENLKAIASDPRNIVAANNKYDAEYIKYFTGLKEVLVLPNYCGYTNASYTPTRHQILVGPARGINDELYKMLQQAAKKASGKCVDQIKNKALCTDNGDVEFRRIRDLYPHFEYLDLAAHPAIIVLPYQVSIMSIFEYYRMAIPIFVPSIKLLTEWQLKYRVMRERTWAMTLGKKTPRRSPIKQAQGGSYPYDPNDEVTEEAIAFWIQFADFYQWPHITTFNSFDDLMDQLLDSKLDLAQISLDVTAYNERMLHGLKQKWRAIFHKMFNNLKPAKIERRDQIDDFNAALIAKYGSNVTGSCVGDTHGHSERYR